MSTSKVDIANLALDHLGQGAIQSFSEQSAVAVAVNRLYDRTRRAALRSYTWRFALKTADLAYTVDAYAGNYSYSHVLPSDCVRVVMLLPESTPPIQFEVAGQNIWTNESTPKLLYIWDNDEPATYDELFIDFLSYVLASRLAMPLTSDVAKQQSQMQLAQRSLMLARGVSGSEARKPPSIATSFRTSRL